MVVSTGPGRPGNLTPEEEIKLQDFWVAVLKVFGVITPTPTSTTDVDPPINGHDATGTPTTDSGTVSEDSSRARADTVGSEKSEKKKKRLGLFGRKKTVTKPDSDADSPLADTTNLPGTPSSTSAPAAPAEDKYDQTASFKLALASQTPESLRSAFWSMAKHDHPDALLLRFLRARKWDIEAALIMLVSTMHWRSQEMHVDDDIMTNGEGAAVAISRHAGADALAKKEADDFLAQIRMGKSYLHGLDREGRPICFCRARLHEKGMQSETSLERYTVYLIETARLVMPGGVDTACLVFDLTSFSLANMDYAPVRFMIKCFEANYPESLGVVVVHRAPWIFQGIWTIIRGWLDPVVASKVNFTKNVEELEKFIPRERISKDMGGGESWEWRYEEVRDGENEKMKDKEGREALEGEMRAVVERFEAETRRWIDGRKDGDAAEKDGGRKGREEAAERLRENYWKLDPYIRARSVYDRVGLLGEGGRLTFYPDKEDVKKVENGTGTGTGVQTSAEDVD